MAKNLEIKCRLNNFNSVNKRINSIRGVIYTREYQTDIYYKVKTGRLKLRIINNEKGVLIHYQRPENKSRRISHYILSETKSHKELDEILRSQFDVLIIVRKQRDICLNKNIRIHLDNVKGLGKFLEIEVIYKNLSMAKKQMDILISYLGLIEKDFIKASYSDLLINKK